MFECTKCGECCRNLNKSPLYKDLDDGNGICIYLKGNLCDIYHNRPLLCRVDECYQLFFKDKIGLEEYYQLNYEMCRKLQKK